MTPLIHSIWLLPKTEDETLLAEMVAELSRRFDTPLFAPHLTVKGDTDLPLEQDAKKWAPVFRIDPALTFR
jgi:hypothetical protein